jgi:hypothetical protein
MNVDLRRNALSLLCKEGAKERRKKGLVFPMIIGYSADTFFKGITAKI